PRDETPASSDGPGRDRTCDLGIKSPAEQAATNCDGWKRAATSRNCVRNELQQDVGDGDRPVRTSVRTLVADAANGVGRAGAFGAARTSRRWRIAALLRRTCQAPPHSRELTGRSARMAFEGEASVLSEVRSGLRLNESITHGVRNRDRPPVDADVDEGVAAFDGEFARAEH